MSIKNVDSNSIPIPQWIPQELVDYEVNLRMKHGDIDELRYFEEDFIEGVEWAQQQGGNIAIDFAGYAVEAAFGGSLKTYSELFEEFINDYGKD